MEDGSNQRLINTGNIELDNTIRIFLSTGMFLAAVISFFLDNTIGYCITCKKKILFHIYFHDPCTYINGKK